MNNDKKGGNNKILFRYLDSKVKNQIHKLCDVHHATQFLCVRAKKKKKTVNEQLNC